MGKDEDGYIVEYWEDGDEWGVTEAGVSILEDIAGTDTLAPDPAVNDNHELGVAANDNA